MQRIHILLLYRIHHAHCHVTAEAFITTLPILSDILGVTRMKVTYTYVYRSDG